MGRRQHRYRGQAIAELVIGLVGMAALLLGLIAVFELGRANVASHLEARSAVAAQLASGSDSTGAPAYVGRWNDGPDGMPFTADDSSSPWGAVGNDISTFTNELTVGSGDGLFDLSTPPLYRNDFSPPSNSLVGAAELHGAARGARIPLDCGLRRLLNIEETAMRVEDRTYFPHLELEPLAGGAQAAQ